MDDKTRGAGAGERECGVVVGVGVTGWLQGCQVRVMIIYIYIYIFERVRIPLVELARPPYTDA